MSSYYSGSRTPSTSPYNNTYQVIRSSPFTEHDWAGATDDDAPADEWDDAEYHRQMQVHSMKQYEKTCLMDLRRICKGHGLRVRGNKHELVERLASDDVEKIYGGSASLFMSIGVGHFRELFKGGQDLGLRRICHRSML